MSTILSPSQSPEIDYPDSDGQRMADNTEHFDWIVRIEGGLQALFRNRTGVFVAGDLLWYPVEGHPEIRVAPDAMVAFGRPKGRRGSYRQWVEASFIDPTERVKHAEPERQRAALEQQRAERYAAKLRELGIDPAAL